MERGTVVMEPVQVCLEQLHLIGTGNIPRSETALLRDLLTRSPEGTNGLVSVNAYKHRLHALRCENINLRRRIHDLETQLNQMRATRGWKLLEKYRQGRRTVWRWLHPFSKADETGPHA
jgi:hypothetical protein